MACWSRGLGVGRAILQKLIDDAHTLGYRTIRLDSARFRHEAHALYRRFGFVPSSPHEWEFESMPALRETAVFMRLDLWPGLANRGAAFGLLGSLSRPGGVPERPKTHESHIKSLAAQQWFDLEHAVHASSTNSAILSTGIVAVTVK
jgi:acetyltransferase (GNAT) family protein